MINISNRRSSIVVWSSIALLAWAIVVALYYLANDAYVWLGTEDQPGENMTSVFYFGAGFLMLWRSGQLVRKQRSTLLREVLPILIALFFVFVGGEEISWGQRLFGFSTPEMISANNVQGETTLHNLTFFDRGGAVLNQHTALNLIALFMGVVVPLAYRFSSPLRRLMDRLNFPPPPLSVTMWFIVGLAHSQTLAKVSTHWAHTEIKELIFSIGFFCYGWAVWRGTNRSELPPVAPGG